MELVASSSSSKPFCTPTKVKTKYDVFISFRGEDTRYGFTTHLYDALHNKKVEAYLDEVTLRRGDQISPALLQAIRQSKISVIIFSENYADSPWCLDELVRIMECKEIHGQQVVPVFYHVDPSRVRNQKGTYEAAFVELEHRFKDKMERVQEWRTALTKAANLSGWNTHQIKSESKLIKTLVEDIINKLKSMFSSSDFLDQNTRNIIIADGQLRIIYMASRILSTQTCHYDCYACICYPGNEIPEWFNYIADSSEIVQLPLNWKKSNFLGFAVCFVAEFEEYNHSRGGLRILFEFQAKTKSGECHKSRCILEIGHYNYEKTASRIKNDIVNSDHVFMLYEYKSFLACQEIEEAHNVNGVSFSICPIGGDDVTPIHSCRVKTCGIRLLYVEEAQEFGLLTKPDYGRTSKVAEEDDDSSTSIDLSKLSDSTVEEEDVDGFFGDFSSNDCENKIRDSHEPSEITKDDESNVSDLDDSALKKEDCDTPSTITAAIDYVEEGEGSLSLNWFEPISRCHATLNSASTAVKENEQEPTESEITPNSAAKEHEEDVKPSESGSMDSIEANNEDQNSYSNGICKWFFGNKYGNELNQETSSSSGSVHERLQALEVTVQHLQSENTKLRDQNHQLSQQYLQMPATIPKSPLLESSSPFSMQLPDQNIQILQYYTQMTPADQNILYYPQTVMTILPPRFPAHPFVQNQHMSQHPQMMMSRPLLGFSSGIPTNQANHQRPSSSSQQ